MGTLTLDSGSGDGKGTLNLHVPAKHVGNALVHYSLVEKDDGTTFARTLDRKERMTLIAESATDSKGNKLISTKGIQYNGKIISWDNIIAWQEPEAKYSTFDKPNNIANLKLFIREKSQNIILNENNALPLGVLYGKESLETHFPTLLDTSRYSQENKVSEYVKSLVHEFGSGVPARVIGIGIDADVKEFFGKDKLYHLQNNIDSMFHYSNGKNIEALQQSKRHADSQALTRSTAKKNYAKGIDALCTDWSAKTMKGWTDKDKLRCAAIENVIKKGWVENISQSDAEKYLPTIYSSDKFKNYIDTVYAESGYLSALSTMVNSNDFSNIQDVKVLSSRSENIKKTISKLEDLASLNPKKIKSELKRKEKELLNHLEDNGITDDDAKTLEYGQEIGKLARQLNLLKNKAYRKEIISLKIELKNITEAEPEPGSMASMVAVCLKNNNVENEFSQKGINTLRELRDSKISGLHELKNKYERESSRQQIAWLDNHIESFAVKDAIKDFSVVRSYYHDLSPKDKVLFLQQESAMAWDKYASYSSKEHTSGNRELARKYHHLAITRESQLKYLLSSIEIMVDIKGAAFTFSSHALREISTLNDDKLTSVNEMALNHHQNKESKEQCRATEKQAKRVNEFLKWVSDLPQNAKTNATVGQPSQPEANEHIVDTQTTEAVVNQASEPDLFIDMLPSEEEVEQSSESGAEDPLFELLATDAVVGQATEPVEKDLFIDMLSNEEEMGRASESVEDALIVGLNSGKETIVSNTSTVSTGSTVPVEPNTPEFKITFNNEVYTLKNVNALEEMARKTSDRAEKKEMLKEIERQKSIFKKISIPYDGVEFTEKGMCVTKLEKQGDAEHKKFLKVEVKYFYDSNGKLDELATEYKPISGNGDLKIPGVNGKIYTIPGCIYKKYERGLAASHFYEYFKQVEEAKTTRSSHEGFIEYIDSLINENRFDYIRSMTPSELDDFREQVGGISQQKLIDSTTSKIESYFKPQIAENENNPGQENIISINSGNRIPIINSETKGLDPRLMTIVNKFPGVFEEYKNNGNNFSSKVISEFCKSNESEVRNILAENYIELKSEGGIFLRFMADLLFVASRVDSGAPYLLKDESTVQIKSLLSPDVEGFRSNGLTSIKFKNGVDLPLNELFVKKRYSGADVTIDVKNKFNYPIINETTSFKDKFMWQEEVKTSANNSRVLLDVVVPTGRIAQEVIKNDDISEVNIESQLYKYDLSILEKMGVDKTQFVEVINNFRLKNSGLLEVYQDEKYNCDNSDGNSYFDFKMIETNSDFKKKFNQFFGEKYSDPSLGSISAFGDNEISDDLSDVARPRDYLDDMIDALVQDDNVSLPKTGTDKPTAAVSVESMLSPVSENISQELPLRTLAPSQSLQENNVIGKTMSGREIRRLQESSRSRVNNSNEIYIQKNEKVVENSQNTDKIKRHDESVISTDGVHQSQKVKETVNAPSSDLTPEKSLSIGTNLKLLIGDNGKYSFSPDIPKGSVQSIDGLQSWRVSSLQNKVDSVAFMELYHDQFVDKVLNSDLKDEILTQALIRYVKININESASKYINKHKNKTDIFKVASYKLTPSKSIKAIAPNFNRKEKIDAMANILKSKAEYLLHSNEFANVIHDMEVPSDKKNSLVNIKASYEDFLSMYRRMLVGPGGLIPDEGLAYRIYNGCLQVVRIKDNAITSTSYSLSEGTKPKELFIPNLVTTNMTIETHDATVLSTFLDAKVTPMTDPAFIKELSMDKLMSDMLELAKKQEHDRIDTQLDDNDPHVLEPSLSNENETAAVQPADDLLQSKTPERGLSRKELNRLYSNRPVLAQ